MDELLFCWLFAIMIVDIISVVEKNHSKDFLQYCRRDIPLRRQTPVALCEYALQALCLSLKTYSRFYERNSKAKSSLYSGKA